MTLMIGLSRLGTVRKRALSLLNKAHLIHCDLKPENILLKKSVSPVTFQGRFWGSVKSRLDVGVDSLAFIASRTEVNDLDDWALGTKRI
jgi:serine/threonine protein kinase